MLRLLLFEQENEMTDARICSNYPLHTTGKQCYVLNVCFLTAIFAFILFFFAWS
jgi:hypothetical protein